MKTDDRFARRYHWNSFGLESFVKDPHKGVITTKFERPLNLVDATVADTQTKMVELANDGTALLKELTHVSLPSHHPIFESDYDRKSLEKILSLTKEVNPKDFEDLLLVKGLGEKNLKVLALTANLILVHLFLTKTLRLSLLRMAAKMGIHFLSKEMYTIKQSKFLKLLLKKHT